MVQVAGIWINTPQTIYLVFIAFDRCVCLKTVNIKIGFSNVFRNFGSVTQNATQRDLYSFQIDCCHCRNATPNGIYSRISIILLFDRVICHHYRLTDISSSSFFFSLALAPIALLCLIVCLFVNSSAFWIDEWRNEQI